MKFWEGFTSTWNSEGFGATVAFVMMAIMFMVILLLAIALLYRMDNGKWPWRDKRETT
jgi:hypothetical protein